MRLLVIGYGIERQQSGKKLVQPFSTYITFAINLPAQFLSSLLGRSANAGRIYEVVGFGFSAISLTGLGEWLEGGRYQGGRKEPTASVLRQRARGSLVVALPPLHRRGFSVSGSNNVSGCRLYGVRPGTGECPVGSSDDARSPGATAVRTYISILTNHYYMPGEPRWAERALPPPVLRTWTKFTNNSPGLAFYNGPTAA